MDSTHVDMRKIMLTEVCWIVTTNLIYQILARALKNHLNSLLRKEMEQICIPSRDPYIRVIVGFLNFVMKNERYPDTCKLIKAELIEQFPATLDEDEQGGMLYSSIVKTEFFVRGMERLRRNLFLPQSLQAPLRFDGNYDLPKCTRRNYCRQESALHA